MDGFLKPLGAVNKAPKRHIKVWYTKEYLNGKSIFPQVEVLKVGAPSWHFPSAYLINQIEHILKVGVALGSGQQKTGSNLNRFGP